MRVKVWIVFESKTPFALETAEVPQDFCQAWIVMEHLWHIN